MCAIGCDAGDDPNDPANAGQDSGPDESCLGDSAWYNENAEGRSRAVASKQPNAFGLYDMLPAHPKVR